FAWSGGSDFFKRTPLRLPDPTSADEHRLDSLVAAARPAHMPYTVQVTAAERIPER
ncbi:phage tail protein, partial [Streptomyces scabiei]|nr:phage tail protein [Streptomyces scabiei]